MRVLVVSPGPRFSVDDVYKGWVEALEGLLGEPNVETFDLDDHLSFFSSIKRAEEPGAELTDVFAGGDAAVMTSKHLEAVLYEFWPDVILIVSGFYVPPFVYQLARKRKHKVVLLHTESPYEDMIQMQRASFADLNLINDPTNLDAFKGIAPTVYMPHAYRPTVHCPGPAVADYKSDVCFVGTGYLSRIAFLEAIDWTGVDLALGGHWRHLDADSPLRPHVAHPIDECLDNTATVEAYRSTKVSFNLYRVEAMTDEHSDGWAMGPREVELAATGTFFARQSRPEGDELLPMLPVFSSPDELSDIVRHYLTHDDEREAAANAARAALADRTFESNARTLLQLL